MVKLLGGASSHTINRFIISLSFQAQWSGLLKKNTQCPISDHFRMFGDGKHKLGSMPVLVREQMAQSPMFE